MRAFAVQIAGLEGSLHARYPARKSSRENKEVEQKGSRALYVGLPQDVNRATREVARERAASGDVEGCG
jgi:hypothetical protein